MLVVDLSSPPPILDISRCNRLIARKSGEHASNNLLKNIQIIIYNNNNYFYIRLLGIA